MASSDLTARQQVEAVIEQYRVGFASMDIDALVGMWDQSYDDLVYIALEESQPRRTWKEIETYYRQIPPEDPNERIVGMQLHDLSVGVLGEVAHVFCRFQFTGERNGKDRYVIEGRNTFVLHRLNGNWQVIHYHESALPQAVAGL